MCSRGDSADFLVNTGKFDERAEAEDYLTKRFGKEYAREDLRSTGKKSQATLLVELTEQAGAVLWHDPDSVSWATIAIDGHRENWPIRSRGFRKWLNRLFYLEERKAPGSQSVQDALGVLEGQGLYDGAKHPIFTRLAEHEGRYYLDLVDDDWRVVEITPAGWKIITDPPVRFRRAGGMLALPAPLMGGSTNQFRELLNLGDGDDWALLISWLIAAFRPVGPYPVLALHGEQGSAKSTTARLLRLLIDPNSASSRTEPREARDLMIAATNGWIVSFDNLSRIPPWLSDTLCCLATGAAFATRQLYTDNEEMLFSAQRPIIINAIEEIATRGDLLDRIVPLYLPKIEESMRKLEKVLLPEFERIRPGVLGALLTAVAQAMSRIDIIRLDKLPRMADFAQWSVAAEPGLGLTQGSFMAAYTKSRESANELLLESSLVAQALLQLPNDTIWEDTATNLLDQLTSTADIGITQRKEWPKNGQAFSGVLRRLAPNLRTVGIDVEFSRESRTRRRLIVLRKNTQNIVPRVPSVPTTLKSPDRGDAGDTGDDLGDDVYAPQNEEFCAPGDGGDAADDELHINSKTPYTLITDSVEARALAQELLTETHLGVDLETTGLDPHTDRIRLLQLSTGEKTWIIDCFQVSVLELRELLESGPIKIGHNIQFDWEFLFSQGIKAGPLFCTMLADQVIHNLGHGRSLKDLAQDYLGIELDKSHQKDDWSKPVLSHGQLVYAARDAALLLSLAHALMDKARELERQKVVALENKALPAIGWMGYQGVGFDLDDWTLLADRAEEQVRDCEAAMNNLVATSTGGGPVNWRSAKQVKDTLNRGGVMVADTREETLQMHKDHPIVTALLDYREQSKRAGTYGVDWLRHLNMETGRIHPDWKQIGAESGRMACTNPNMQNLPRSKDYRSCFTAGPGKVFIKADYSQIELRVAAEISGDKNMTQAFLDNEDIHIRAACLVTGKETPDITLDERQVAKSLNFGMIFGLGAKGLASQVSRGYGIELTEPQARELIDNYFRAFPGLREWRSQQGKLTTTRTLAGRLRDISGTRQYTEALNSPVQGTAADGMKLALAELWRTRPPELEGCFPVACIHDELIVEAPSDKAEAAQEWVVTAMKTGMGKLLRHVPVVVDSVICQSYAGEPADA